MKTFVISIPKSGTYLMREILEQAGLGESQLHISESGTYDYSKISYEEGRRKPNLCKMRMPLKESLSLIPENSFAVGHLAYSEETAELLKDFNVLFIGRDIKEMYLSFMIYQLETGRSLRDPIDSAWALEQPGPKQFTKFIQVRGDKLMTKYVTKILPWKEQKDVQCFDFNKLRSDPFLETARILETLGGEYTDNQIRNIIDGSLNKPTQTLSKKKERLYYWNTKVHNQIDSLIEKYQIT